MKNDNIRKLTFSAMFTAIAVVLIFIPLPPFPFAEFLLFNLADVPIMLLGILISPIYSLASLLIVAFVQAFFLGKDGPVGFLMHVIASGAMTIILSLSYKYLKKYKAGFIMSLALATVAMTGVMLLLNRFITPGYMGVPVDVVKAMLPTVFLPFNLLKGILISVLTSVFYHILQPALKRSGIMKTHSA